jgi:CDP-4-dehydro-6-deoxyglucose reductase
VIEARSVPAEGVHPVLKMPVRVQQLERAAPDVLILQLQLPATQNFRYHAGQYLEFLLKDGSRRAYSMANAPGRMSPASTCTSATCPAASSPTTPSAHEGEGDPARRRPVRQLLPARRLRQADRAAGQRHRLRADQGADRAARAQRQHAPATLYWGGRARRTSTWHDWVREAAPRLP